MKRKKLEINKKILDEFLNLYSFEIINPKTTKTNQEINKIWQEFKKMNPNADSFLPTQKKILKVGSACFLPTNDP